MGFRAEQAPWGTQDGPGRGVWKDRPAQLVPKVSEDRGDVFLSVHKAEKGLGEVPAPLMRDSFHPHRGVGASMLALCAFSIRINGFAKLCFCQED